MKAETSWKISKKYGEKSKIFQDQIQTERLQGRIWEK